MTKHQILFLKNSRVFNENKIVILAIFNGLQSFEKIEKFSNFNALTLLGLGLIKTNIVLANFNNPRPSLKLNN